MYLVLKEYRIIHQPQRAINEFLKSPTDCQESAGFCQASSSVLRFLWRALVVTLGLSYIPRAKKNACTS